jgi:hypothetical protein
MMKKFNTLFLALFCCAAISLPVAAKTVTLSGTEKNSCSFVKSPVTVASGDVTYTCEAVVTPPPVTPPVGPADCPASAVNKVGVMGDAGFVNVLDMPSGKIATFNLPRSDRTRNVDVSLYEGTKSFPVAPYRIEIQISRCKGAVLPATTPEIVACTAASESNTSLIKKFVGREFTTRYPTKESFLKIGRCYAPDSQGPWYVNVRYVYAGCTAVGVASCGWVLVWHEGSNL